MGGRDLAHSPRHEDRLAKRLIASSHRIGELLPLLRGLLLLLLLLLNSKPELTPQVPAGLAVKAA